MGYVIEIDKLSKFYGEIKAVSDLNLKIQSGEMFGLVGPDGAGKTTLVRTLCGILKPNSGHFTMFDMDGVKHRSKIKNKIGYLSQEFSLYGDLTVDENITFFAKIHNVKNFKQKKDILLRKMGVERFGSRLADRLSGGMKKKLALACTLIHSPEILFLDEPTTGVDPVSRREFWQILAGLKKDGITIFVTTPYLDEAERCDRVAFMYNGDILESDYPQKIKNSFKKKVLEAVCSPVKPLYEYLKRSKNIENIQTFGDRVHVVFDESKITYEKLKNELFEKGFDIKNIRIVSPSLEDIFIIKLAKSKGDNDEN